MATRPTDHSHFGRAISRGGRPSLLLVPLIIVISSIHAHAAGGVIPISRAQLVIDSTVNRADLPRCLCPGGPSQRNLLGLERPTPHALGKRALTDPVTLRILAIRVEFPYEESDDPLTTGRGRFDRRDTTVFFDSAGHSFDTSPHNRRYFAVHLRALDQYWNVVSNGRLSLESHVFPVAEDSAYRVPQPTGYYGRERDGDSGLVFGLRQFIEDAATAAAADPAIRFADYDGVIIFHAGTSRQFDVLNDSPHDLFSVFIRRDDPVILNGGADTLGEAILVPETISQDGRIGVLNGVLAHEFGHQLGLVDLYNTFNFTTQVGNFSLMDNNANDVGIETEVEGQRRILFGAVPVFPDAWSRAYLGFVDVLTVTDSTPVTVWTAEEEELAPFNRQVWRVPISATEYYLLENRRFDLDGDGEAGLRLDSATSVVLGPAHPLNRQLTREYDFLLPGSGMLIWHVDEGVAALDYATGDEIPNNFLANTLQWDHDRRFLRVVEADGYNRLGSTGFFFFYTGSQSTYWFTGNNNAFTPFTVPPARSYTGGYSGVNITNISAPQPTMTCAVQSGGRIPGFPIYVGAASGNAAAPILTDVVRAPSGDFRGPGDGRPEVFIGYKHYVLAFDLEGQPLTQHPVEDTVISFDTTRIVRTYYPVAMGQPGDQWIGPPLVFSLDNQTGSLAAVSQSGQVGLWSMSDRDMDGLFDPIVDTVIRTRDIPSGPPLIWDRNGSASKDLVVPVGDSGFDTFSLLDGARVRHEYSGFIGDIAGLAATSSFSTELLDGQWTAGILEPGWPRRVLGSERPFAPAVADIDHDGALDAVVLERNGRLHAFTEVTQPGGMPQYFPNFPVDLGFRPSADPILADLDRDGRLEIIAAGEGKVTALAHNGAIANDFPVTIGPRNDPDTTAPGLLAVDFDGTLLSILTGGMSRATLAYRQGREMQTANYAVGGAITAPMACAIDAAGNCQVMFARADDGHLYGFVAPSPDRIDAKALWSMGGRDARNSRAIPFSDLNPIAVDDVFFAAERAYVYPNPAQNEAVIRYWLGDAAVVTISVYDIAGNLVAESSGPGIAGVYNEWTWDCADAASGVYYARLEVTALDGGQSEKLFCKLAVVQ